MGKHSGESSWKLISQYGCKVYGCCLKSDYGFYKKDVLIFCILLLHSSVAAWMGFVLETNLAEMGFALVGFFFQG